jgi:hypothetical protein
MSIRVSAPVSLPGSLGSISYACERCKTESSMEPRRAQLSRRDSLRACWRAADLKMAGGSYRKALAQIRVEMLDEAEETAYREFNARFRFCHDCRRFVCPSCWSSGWGTCRTCVARAMKRMSPRRRHFRTALSLMVIAGSIMLMLLGVGTALATTLAS